MSRVRKVFFASLELARRVVASGGRRSPPENHSNDIGKPCIWNHYVHSKVRTSSLLQQPL